MRHIHIRYLIWCDLPPLRDNFHNPYLTKLHGEEKEVTISLGGITKCAHDYNKLPLPSPSPRFQKWEKQKPWTWRIEHKLTEWELEIECFRSEDTSGDLKSSLSSSLFSNSKGNFNHIARLWPVIWMCLRMQNLYATVPMFEPLMVILFFLIYIYRISFFCSWWTWLFSSFLCAHARHLTSSTAFL